jgi:hypothetical protein
LAAVMTHIPTPTLTPHSIADFSVHSFPDDGTVSFLPSSASAYQWRSVSSCSSSSLSHFAQQSPGDIHPSASKHGVPFILHS